MTRNVKLNTWLNGPETFEKTTILLSRWWTEASGILRNLNVEQNRLNLFENVLAVLFEDILVGLTYVDFSICNTLLLFL
jgi:hypothetical protein